MTTHKITFFPDNKEIQVDEDTTVLEAAQQADVCIDSTCGGVGLCGQCRVRIVSGKARADNHALAFLSADEIQKGFVLACQTKIEDDLVVQIPEKSRGEEQIIMTSTPVAYGEPEKVYLQKPSAASVSSTDPIVRKIYLELPSPTLTDNASDIDRITRQLGKLTPYKSFEISLTGLQGLSEQLRGHDWKVTASITSYNGVGKILKIEGGDTTASDYGLAVDVGTTTVVVQLVDLKTGNIIDTKGSHNLQARYGDDVISRMVFACVRGSMDPVHKAVITNINTLTENLLKENKVNREDVNALVAAGNTTMSHFLMNLPPCAIRLEPYVPTATVYPQIRASELGIKISPEAVMEIVPSVASYIGGDIVAGVLACGMAEKKETRCLIDIGTNGEIVIGNYEWLVCCSASAGPAFEGAGAKNGMRATAGAIEKVKITGKTLHFETIGGVKPRGICGSGLIDIIYEMVRNGIIEQDGKFNQSRHDSRLEIQEADPRYVVAFGKESESGEPITISESEIANLIKSKGAIFAAIKSLADYVGIGFEQFETIYVAGGFGSSLNIPKAIAIGLLPDIDTKKIQFIGNSSLTGARMTLLSNSSYARTRDIARRMTNIELSNYASFMNEFIAALFLPHTDSRLFPSVKYGKKD